MNGSKPFVKIIENQYVRSGNLFVASTTKSGVASAGTFSMLLTVPNTTIRAHAIFNICATNASLVTVYEDPTVSGAGTAVTAYNANRNSSTAATVVATHTPSVTGGNAILSKYVGAGIPGDLGNDGGSGLRLILKQNEQYEIRVTAGADNTNISIIAEWFEV